MTLAGLHAGVGRAGRRLGLAGGSAAGRARNWIFLTALGATVLLVAVAVGALAARARDQRAAMHRALARELSNAAFTLVDGVMAEHRQADFVLTAPVYGTRVAEGNAPMRLADFSRATAELLGALELDGDPRAGTFRVDLRAPWPTPAAFESAGSLRDSALRAAVLARLAARQRAYRVGSPARVASDSVRVGPDPVHLLYVRQRDDAGEPVALLGFTYSVGHWYGRIVPRLVERMPLLPPDFYGVDWVTAAPAIGARDPAAPQAVVRKSSARNNAVLALEVTAPNGSVVYRSPRADPAAFAARGGPRIVFHGFVIRVAVPPAHADRLVAAAVPFGAEGWLLGGVALAGALFVVGAVVELRRQQQLAEERRHFVSAVSHELRTPLAHMVLVSETLLGPAAQTAEQRRRWLTVIHREAVRLGALVDNVQLHARGELRDVPLELRPVDVGAVAQDVVAMLDAAAAARRARVRAVVRAVVPPGPEVHADAGAVRQVLLNLVDNALRYGPEGQTVTLTVAPPCAPGAPLVVTVEDEGPGIPPGDRHRVWAPFVRLGERGGVTGGTGLGLSVVRDLVRQHGGEVAIADARGGGARFVVTLPQRPVPARRGASTA